MIESNFLCSGVWESDPFQELNSITEIPSLNIEDYDFTHNFQLSECSTPNDLSSSSSDYEGLVLDELNIFPISDTFVSTILEENDAVGFSDLDWLSSDPSKQCNSPAKSIKNLEENISVHRSSSGQWQSSKLWSKMSPAQQLETLHALSEIVTYHMGIREQMEIIKIIDPSAIISPEDKEFALDNSFLDDAKFKLIRDFIKELKLPLQDSTKSVNSLASIYCRKTSSSSKLVSRKSSHLPYSRTKRRQKKQKIQLPFEDKVLKRKRRKQDRKEEKSGLFVHETKVKLEIPIEEDEDVNILE